MRYWGLQQKLSEVMGIGVYLGDVLEKPRRNDEILAIYGEAQRMETENAFLVKTSHLVFSLSHRLA